MNHASWLDVLGADGLYIVQGKELERKKKATINEDHTWSFKHENILS
jgi:hypothetical protein